MGKYINVIQEKTIGASYKDKIDAIKADGGVIISEPDEFIPNLVCVVNNGAFAAAGWVYDELEFEEFKSISTRPTTWLKYSNVSQVAK